MGIWEACDFLLFSALQTDISSVKSSELSRENGILFQVEIVTCTKVVVQRPANCQCQWQIVG